MTPTRKVRPPHKGKLSAKGLWSLSVGEHPTVTVREDRVPGGRILFDYRTHGKRAQPPTGVRSVRQGNQWDREAIDALEALARDLSAKLRLDRLRQEVKPTDLTLQQAFAMYNQPRAQGGGLADSKSSRVASFAAARAWKNHLDDRRHWNTVAPRDVDSLAQKLRARGQLKTAEQRVKWLRTVYRWLRDRARVKGLEDPTQGFDFKALMEGYEPKRPPYSLEEAEKIVSVAREVDPRFRLLVALMDDSIVRRKALINLWRSAVDAPLLAAPTPEQAPHGWIVYPALKGAAAYPWFLTDFQRRELDTALTTYLAAMEHRYQTEGKDYPLFPAARMYEEHRKHGDPIAPMRNRAYEPVSEGLTDKWMRAAEALTGVEHVKGRLWHGLRRTSSNVVYDQIGLSGTATAGGWGNERTLAAVYLGKSRFADRARARMAMEEKRKRPSDTTER